MFGRVLVVFAVAGALLALAPQAEANPFQLDDNYVGGTPTNGSSSEFIGLQFKTDSLDITINDTGTDGAATITGDNALIVTFDGGDGTTPQTTFRSPGTGTNSLQVFLIDIEDQTTPRFIVREDGDVLFPGTSASDTANLNTVLIGLSSNASGDGTATGEGQVAIGRAAGCQAKDGCIAIGSHVTADGALDAEDHVILIGQDVAPFIESDRFEVWKTLESRFPLGVEFQSMALSELHRLKLWQLPKIGNSLPRHVHCCESYRSELIEIRQAPYPLIGDFAHTCHRQ